MEVTRIAAFSDGAAGGNPAGVVISAELPDVNVMQQIAREVGYSEAAFAAPLEAGWRVRYFAPESEIPFCGHATIALGAVLALRYGSGIFPLHLNDAQITVEGRRSGMDLSATLQSPPTKSMRAPNELVSAALNLFSYTACDLDPTLPPALASAGARHLILALANRQKLAEMSYDLDAGRSLMTAAGIVTISLVHAERLSFFHARNPFAAGGVYEDPATGAAAAALGGYLRDVGWPHGGAIEIMQGEDMGMPSRVFAEITPERGAGIRVSGHARPMYAASLPFGVSRVGR